MLERFYNIDLRQSHTFGMNVSAKEIVYAHQESEAIDFILKNKDKTYLILGGGSNVLFVSETIDLVFKPALLGYNLLKEENETILVEASAGVDWDEFVSWTVENGWGGLENLSLIPGTIGACPIQNIGAYGVEVKDSIEAVEGLYLENADEFRFSAKDCQFGYRTSIFKNSLKNKCLITKVVFRLTKSPSFILNYGNLEEELKKYDSINLENIRKAVIAIRESKLPDPKVIGNAGSFFKNPFIQSSKARELKVLFPNLPLFEAENGFQKTSAAFLIDKAGWKGFRQADAGVHEKQALVLVNYGKAKGTEIATLAKEIQEDIKNRFGILLETEVNLVG